MANKFELKKRRRKGNYVSAGTLIIKKCDVSVPFSFIDYIQSGVVINTVIAVDMSSSNGNPADPTSLQYKNPANPNEYVIALRAVGSVLGAYDTTKTFPAYAFGAALPPLYEEAAHVFALTGNYVTQPECNGIEDVIHAYYAALNRVAPFQPCRYGPMLEHVIKTAKAENGRDGKIVYTVLLVITDGEFSDFADVANLICSAADLPLSIVIVGVGKSKFTELEKLDGDTEPLCSTDGTPCARDIVQFVPFHKHRFNTHQLAREVLDEIPEQFLSYMRSRGIKPQDIQPPSPVRRHSVGPFYPNNDMTSTVSLHRTFSASSPSVPSLPTSPAVAPAVVPPPQLTQSTAGAFGIYHSTHGTYTPMQSKYIPGQSGALPAQTGMGHSVPTSVPSPFGQMYRPPSYNPSSTYGSLPYGTQVSGAPFGGHGSLYQASTSGHHVYQPR
ncbi:Copine [Gracilaria domingensis]|nr:Copine [Gracilaria domingensis]